MAESYIIDAVRTPIGKLGGALSGVRPDDLAAGVVRALVDRNGSIDPAAIDQMVFGDANGAGEDNRNVARMAVLLAGLPVTIPGSTTNRLCGSGMDAIAQVSRELLVGDADLAIAGGVESMTRAPWVLPKPAKGFPTTHEQLWNSALGWRMVNTAMPGEWTIALGEGAEVLADKYSINRDEQDEFALQSHQRAAAAWDAGRFDDEVVRFGSGAGSVAELVRDECVRADSTLASLGKLKPVFRSGGTVTAGNASPMNDGAAALLMASSRAVERFGLSPIARVVSRATSGVEPHLYGIGPVEAAQRALHRGGLMWSDIATVELNEAFAAQSIACLREWPDLDPATVNPDGGAIAIGHPLGSSGARITTTLVHRLRRTGARYGLAAMCIGVGQGIAIVVENTEGSR
jgi:acetyl-CoA acetyltransferase family protein